MNWRIKESPITGQKMMQFLVQQDRVVRELGDMILLYQYDGTEWNLIETLPKLLKNRPRIDEFQDGVKRIPETDAMDWITCQELSKFAQYLFDMLTGTVLTVPEEEHVKLLNKFKNMLIEVLTDAHIVKGVPDETAQA